MTPRVKEFTPISFFSSWETFRGRWLGDRTPSEFISQPRPSGSVWRHRPEMAAPLLNMRRRLSLVILFFLILFSFAAYSTYVWRSSFIFVISPALEL